MFFKPGVSWARSNFAPATPAQTSANASTTTFIEVFSDLVFTVIHSLLKSIRLRPPSRAAKVVLLTSQGRHRIDRSDAASRNEARPRRSREQQQRYTKESQGICGFDVEQHRRQGPRQRKGGGRSQ